MRRTVLVSAALAATFAVAVVAGLAIGGWDFVRQHLGPLTLAATMVLVLGTVTVRLGMAVLRGAVLAARRPRALGQSGAAMAEFVIAIIPFCLMLFGIMQMALASLARVLVSYSAFCAVRAAIVLVPEEPEEMDKFKDKLKSAATKEAGGQIGTGAGTRTDFAISRKAELMRRAASYALIPASPAIDVVVSDTMHNWSSYFQNRLGAGLSIGDYLRSTIGDVSKFPAAVFDKVNDTIKDQLKDYLKKDETKEQAHKKIEAAIDRMNLPADQKEKLKKNSDAYFDQLADDKAGDVAGWVKNTLNDTIGKGLEQFGDQIGKLVEGEINSATGATGSYGGSSVARALDEGFGAGTDGMAGALMRSLRKLVYARIATVVTLQDEKGNLKGKFEGADAITAKVTYLYYMQIPLVNRIAGKPFYNLPSSTALDMTTGALGPVSAVGIPGYFMALTATHTMVNQGKAE